MSEDRDVGHDPESVVNPCAVWALSALDGVLREYPCNDTCSSQLIPGFACDCWKKQVREALSKTRATPNPNQAGEERR
jgi:hypothetical protein